MPISPFLILDDERKKRQEELRNRYDQQAQQFGQAVLSVPQLQREYEDRTRKLSQEMEDRAFLAKQRKQQETEWAAKEAEAVAKAERARGPGEGTAEMKEDKGFYPQPEEAYTQTPAGYYPQPEERYEKPKVPQKVEFEGPQPPPDMGPLPQPKPEERLAPPPPPGRMVVTPADNSDAAYVARTAKAFQAANPQMPPHLAERAAYEVLRQEKLDAAKKTGTAASFRAQRDALEGVLWHGLTNNLGGDEIYALTKDIPELANLAEPQVKGMLAKLANEQGRKDLAEQFTKKGLELRQGQLSVSQFNAETSRTNAELREADLLFKQNTYGKLPAESRKKLDDIDTRIKKWENLKNFTEERGIEFGISAQLWREFNTLTRNRDVDEAVFEQMVNRLSQEIQKSDNGSARTAMEMADTLRSLPRGSDPKEVWSAMVDAAIKGERTTKKEMQDNLMFEPESAAVIARERANQPVDVSNIRTLTPMEIGGSKARVRRWKLSNGKTASKAADKVTPEWLEQLKKADPGAVEIQ